MIALWFLQVISMAAPHGCLGVSHERILAQDLAERVPGFAALPPALSLTFAPLPGTQRVLARKELAALLRANGLEPSGPLPVICIERESAPLKESDLIGAIKSSLNSAEDVHVDI